MIVRALDQDKDWTFGTSLNNYLRNKDAVIQNIATNLNSFFGDCFFDQQKGLNWFNLLGTKDQTSLNLAITTAILNTDQVISLSQLSVFLDEITRNLRVTFTVQTTYGQQTQLLVLNPTSI